MNTRTKTAKNPTDLAKRTSLVGLALMVVSASFACVGVDDSSSSKEPSAEGAQAQETTQSVNAPVESTMCGGLASIPCPDGFLCVDDQTDNCDPKKGAVDCAGVCVSPARVLPPGDIWIAPPGYIWQTVSVSTPTP